MSLQIGGSEVYLEEKGYSGLDGRADSTPAAAGSYDRVPPGGREDRDQGRAEARESTRPVLFSPQERERQVVVEQPRARGWGSDRIPPGGREGRDQGPAEAEDTVEEAAIEAATAADEVSTNSIEASKNCNNAKNKNCFYFLITAKMCQS